MEAAGAELRGRRGGVERGRDAVEDRRVPGLGLLVPAEAPRADDVGDRQHVLVHLLIHQPKSKGFIPYQGLVMRFCISNGPFPMSSVA